MQDIYKKIVEYFGSQVKTAELVGIKQPSVCAWLSGKAKMSAVNAQKIEKLTNGKFKAIDLCPHLAEIDNLKPQIPIKESL